MRKFAEIIESTTVAPPTNCLWIKGNDALYFTNGKWVSLFKKEDFINITDRFNKHSISLIEAIQTVPTHQRIDGLVITFEDINGDWRIYQFRGNAVDFFDENKWTDLYDYTNYIVKSITPDEEDLTVSKPDKNGNAIVSLKNRVYDESNFSGKGYKILRKNIQTIDGVRKNILTQDMINESNTIYEIRYDFDLNGKELTIKEGCILYFKGGRLQNGKIYFNDTFLIGDLKFHNCYINNEITVNTTISDTSFTGDTKYDSSILKFLILNSAKNNTTLTINRDYNISINDFTNKMIDSMNTKVFALIENNNGFRINFNGHTINENSKSYISDHSFIHLYRCNNVSILKLEYVVAFDDGIANPYERDNATGTQVIKTNGDCGNSIFEVSAKQVGTCIRCGDLGAISTDNLGYSVPNYVHKGIYNSKMIINAYNCGYSAAIYTGENLEIISDFSNMHRGLYASGIYKANITVNGKNIKTPVLALLKDSIYYDTDDINFTTRKYRECKDIQLSVTDTGSTTPYTSMANIDSYYNAPFSERENSYIFSNINITLKSVNDGNINRGVNIYSRAINNTRDKVEVCLKNSDIDGSFVILYSEGDGDTTINMYNCYTPNCSIDVRAQHYLHIENSKFKRLTDRALRKSFVKIVNSELNDISSEGVKSTSLMQLTNTKVSQSNGSYINCFNNLSLKIENELDFNKDEPFYDIYYTELSTSTSIAFNMAKMSVSSYISCYVKNISDTTITLSFTNAELLQGSAVNILPNEIVNLILITSREFKKVKIIAIHNIYSNLLSGGSNLRPNNAIQSSTYFDTDLNQALYYNGHSWVNATGELADIKTSGSFISKPKPNNIGFQYFNTDTHKMITWDGTKWWNPDGTEAVN